MDESVEKEKRYVYSVTPIYKDRIGASIALPTVSTKKGETPIFEDKKILEKNWWDE